MLGAVSVNSTAGIAMIFLFSMEIAGKESLLSQSDQVRSSFFWLQYFLSEPNTLDESSALSLENTSALILYLSSTLVCTKN